MRMTAFPAALGDPALRGELVRYSAHLCGRLDVAEDIVQEALYLALRDAARCPSDTAWRPWVFSIVRNLCRRLVTRSGVGMTLSPDTESAADSILPSHESNDEAVETESDRYELVTAALAQVTGAHRSLLVAHYLEGASPAILAARYGTTVATLTVRLSRARAAMRREIVRDDSLRQLAADHGLLRGDGADGWHETRVWCPRCGAGRLRGHLRRASGATTLAVHCPACNPARERNHDAHSRNAALEGHPLLDGLNSVKPALRRMNDWWDRWYHAALAGGDVPCPKCGRPRVRFAPAGSHRVWFEQAATQTRYPIVFRCGFCAGAVASTPSGLALHSEPVQRFWVRYPRMRMTPEAEVNWSGHPAIRVRFEAVGSNTAAIEVIVARDAFATLAVLDR